AAADVLDVFSCPKQLWRDGGVDLQRLAEDHRGTEERREKRIAALGIQERGVLGREPVPDPERPAAAHPRRLAPNVSLQLDISIALDDRDGVDQHGAAQAPAMRATTS